MRKLSLFIAALLICHTMQAQYFCTNEGVELHYVNYDEVGQSTSDETATVTNVKHLNFEQRKYEIARILGGDNITPLLLENAEEQLKSAMKE